MKKRNVYLLVFLATIILNISYFNRTRIYAELGYPESQFSLAVMYDIESKNHAEAIKWYRKSAENGDPWSQFIMGVMLTNGDGIPVNLDEAKKWYAKAIEYEDTIARFGIDLMYWNSEFLPKNSTEAIRWYNIFTMHGNKMSQYNKEVPAYHGQVFENDSITAKGDLTMANLGAPQAQYNVGRLYYYGNIFPKDYIQTYKWTYLSKENKIAKINTKNKAISLNNKIAYEMTEKEISNAKLLVKEWEIQYEQKQQRIRGINAPIETPAQPTP